jgi:putative transposase
LRLFLLYGTVYLLITSKDKAANCDAGTHAPQPNFGRPTDLRDWPHAPVHRTQQAGAFMVTSATYQKAPLFRSPDQLTLLSNSLLHLAEAYAWQLQAWAIFANHYHFIAECPKPENIKHFVRHLHSSTAIAINREGDTPGREVWFQYWESRITFHRSYFARLNYVHQNPVRHGIVRLASAYPWCSAA